MLGGLLFQQVTFTIQIKQIIGKKKICSIAAEEIKIGQVDYNLSQLQANEIPSTGHEGPQTSLRQVLRPFN